MAETETPDVFDALILAAEQARESLMALSATGELCRKLYKATQDLKEHLQHNVTARGYPLEMHKFPERMLPIAEDLYRVAAEGVGKDGELEIDDNCVVSLSDDGGAYVSSWTWIPHANIGVVEYYKAKVTYSYANGATHLLAEDTCIAANEGHAREILKHRHWVKQLDESECRFGVLFEEVHKDSYELEVQKKQQWDDDDVFYISAPTPELAVEMAEIMRPFAKVTLNGLGTAANPAETDDEDDDEE